MKSPDDIKKGLEKCLARWAATHYSDCRSDCPYWGEEGVWCKNALHSNALTYINQLEDRNEKLENALRNLANSSSNANDAANKVIEHLESRLAQVERERDAAVDDLRNSFDPCTVCKKQDICEQYCPDNDYNCPDCKDKHRCICHNCTADNDLWEWRGVCEKNTKED